MKLSDYLAEHNLSDQAFADRIGRHRVSVTRWRNGSVRPDWDAVAAIVHATNGAVTANDFLPTQAAIHAAE